MNLVLDTCVLIWLTQEPDKLSLAARSAINDTSNMLWFSHASAWEIHLKHHAGKLSLPEPPRLWIPQQLDLWKIREQSISLAAIHRSSDLPDIHRDPFDRMLIAQALEAGMKLVSPDEFFPDYGVEVVW
jgi:PIN domain nuclease of toxin-antitoxin system